MASRGQPGRRSTLLRSVDAFAMGENPMNIYTTNSSSTSTDDGPYAAYLLFISRLFRPAARTAIMWLLTVVGEILGQKRKLAISHWSAANIYSQITPLHCSNRKAILSDGTKTVILHFLTICE